MDAYTPVKQKCTWWRETPSTEDEFDPRLKPGQRRVVCTCFIEGHYWTHKARQVPGDCPYSRKCRYYIRHV